MSPLSPKARSGDDTTNFLFIWTPEEEIKPHTAILFKKIHKPSSKKRSSISLRENYPLKLIFKNTMLRFRFFFMKNRQILRTITVHSSRFLRGFFESSSRVLEGFPKRLRGFSKKPRRMYGYDTALIRSRTVSRR